MPRGSRHGDEVREQAFALLSSGESVSAAAKALGLKYSTLKTWEKMWRSQKLAEPTQTGEGAQPRKTENSPAQSDAGATGSPCDNISLDELRIERKKRFANKAWDMLENTQTLLERRINRAIHKEDVLDELISMVEENKVGYTREEQQKILGKISALRLDDIRALSSILATLYDKQALAVGDPTLNVDGALKYEDF